MKVKQVKTRYGIKSYTIKQLKDLLSDKDPELQIYRKSFDNYKMLLKNVPRRTNERGIAVAKKVVKTFLDLMLTDLIMNNYEFVFQYNKEELLSLHIGYKTFKNTKFYYVMSTGGFFYMPRTKMTNHGKYKFNNLVYYFRIESKYREMFLNEILKKGHKYTNE